MNGVLCADVAEETVTLKRPRSASPDAAISDAVSPPIRPRSPKRHKSREEAPTQVRPRSPKRHKSREEAPTQLRTRSPKRQKSREETPTQVRPRGRPASTAAASKPRKSLAASQQSKPSSSAGTAASLTEDVPTAPILESDHPSMTNGSFVYWNGYVYRGGTLAFENGKLVCRLPGYQEHVEAVKHVNGIYRLKECDRIYWIKLKASGKIAHQNRVIVFSSPKCHPEVVQELRTSGLDLSLLSTNSFLSKEPLTKLGKMWEPAKLDKMWHYIMSIMKSKSASAASEARRTPSKKQVVPLAANRPHRGRASVLTPHAGPSTSPPHVKSLIPELLIPDGECLHLDGAQLVQADISRLRADEFLNDACINFFIKFLTIYLVPKYAHVKEKLFAFTTYFFSRLIAFDAANGEIGHGNVKRWTKALQKEAGPSGIFSRDWVVVPINQNNMHWWLALIIRPSLGDSKVEIDPERSAADTRPIRRSSREPSPTCEVEAIPECDGADLKSKQDASPNRMDTQDAENPELEQPSLSETTEQNMELTQSAKDSEPDDASAPDSQRTTLNEANCVTPTPDEIMKAAEVNGQNDAPTSPCATDSQKVGVNGDEVKLVDPPKEAERKVNLTDHEGPVILLLDSAADQPAEENMYAAEYLKGYLRQEWFNSGQVTEFDTSKVAVRKVKTPKQKNGVDCGVFVIEYLIRFIHDGTLLDSVLSAEPSRRNFGFAQERCTRRRDQLRQFSQKMIVEAIKTGCWDTREIIRRNPMILHEIFDLLHAEKPLPREKDRLTRTQRNPEYHRPSAGSQNSGKEAIGETPKQSSPAKTEASSVCPAVPENTKSICSVDPENTKSRCPVDPENLNPVCSGDPENAKSICFVDPENAKSICFVDPENAKSICSGDPENAKSICFVDPENTKSRCSGDPENAKSRCPVDPENTKSRCPVDPENLNPVCSGDPENSKSICSVAPEHAKSEGVKEATLRLVAAMSDDGPQVSDSMDSQQTVDASSEFSLEFDAEMPHGSDSESFTIEGS